MAQGLLTATLPTKLGGDLNFIARTMLFEFVAPVYSGDYLRCEGTIDSIVTQSSRYKLKMSFSVLNQENTLVLKGATSGAVARTKK